MRTEAMRRDGEYVPVVIRRARKEHPCSRCHQPIDPGDLYEEHNLPPNRDAGVSNEHWWRIRCHAGAWPAAIGCDEARAYREQAERETQVA
jgi:hypothetical protein